MDGQRREEEDEPGRQRLSVRGPSPSSPAVELRIPLESALLCSMLWFSVTLSSCRILAARWSSSAFISLVSSTRLSNCSFRPPVSDSKSDT